MSKKSTLYMLTAAAMLALAPMKTMAQAAAENVYDFSHFDWTKVIEVFKTAIDRGDEYPTPQELETAGITQSDLSFIRSHVKNRPIIGEEGRRFWANFPVGVGGSLAGYPSKAYHTENYSMWNYTAFFGSWNHSIFQTPGASIDAGHKNGTDMTAGSIFFDGSSPENYTKYKKIFQATSTTARSAYDGFTYVKPIVNACRYFGVDGINVNWEVGDASEATKFHQALYKYAHSIDFNNFRLGLYVLSSTLSSYNVGVYYCNENGQISDLMLNYGGERRAASSQSIAEGTSIGSKALYQGFWISNMDKSWNVFSQPGADKIGICAWGDHQANNFWRYNSGSSNFEAQQRYQQTLERAFSGGNRNPLKRPAVNSWGNNMQWSGETPALSTWAGFSTWVPERSTVQGKLPFYTNFNLGNGERYNYKGKKTAGSWYNMANQDVVPTYRWLVTQANSIDTYSDKISVEFTHKDSYTGGSCLILTGDASAETDIVLYKTQLTPNGANVYANIATKCVDGVTPSNLYVIVRVNGQWKEYKVEDNKGKEWQEHYISMADLNSSDVIDRIGLRVKGGSTGYKMYVGKLEINDKHTITPDNINSFTAEKREETSKTMSFKMNWTVNHAPDRFGQVYNSDANIDHFEVMFKDGEDGRVKEIARTTQWAAYVGDVDLEDNKDPWVGVRAVSKDLKTYSPVVWQRLQRDPNAPEIEQADTYGESKMNPTCEGADVARQIRYVEKFETSGATKDIHYTATGRQEDGTQYVRVKNQVLEVEQGQTVQFTLKGYETPYANGNGTFDDLRYCFAGGWIDLNGSGDFDHPKSKEQQLLNAQGGGADPASAEKLDPLGERVFRVGVRKGANLRLVKNGIDGEFTIPEDAVTGQSRLRIVFSDAWFDGEFVPVGLTNKGFTIDFDVKITGNKPQRPRKVETHDQGTPDIPEQLEGGTTGINSTTANTNGTMIVEKGTMKFAQVDKAWIFTVDGKLVKSLVRPTSVRMNSLPAGVYLVKMSSNNVIKTQKITIK